MIANCRFPIHIQDRCWNTEQPSAALDLNMINHFASQSQTCQLFENQNALWPSSTPLCGNTSMAVRCFCDVGKGFFKHLKGNCEKWWNLRLN